uniref:Uncharacterized protein n=1 Tax=Trypanosoma congolense (strain IL3000) TaxID=1068625 RepID=G0URN7_TRYCI|nr:hypothetical protein TCIL3000_8_2680 [Trypanosoma congolense IL3000]
MGTPPVPSRNGKRREAENQDKPEYQTAKGGMNEGKDRMNNDPAKIPKKKSQANKGTRTKINTIRCAKRRKEYICVNTYAYLCITHPYIYICSFTYGWVIHKRLYTITDEKKNYSNGNNSDNNNNNNGSECEGNWRCKEKEGENKPDTRSEGKECDNKLAQTHSKQQQRKVINIDIYIF